MKKSLIAIIAVVAVVGLAIVLLRPERDRPRGQARVPSASEIGDAKNMRDMPGMPGMEGMDMSQGEGATLSPTQVREFGVTLATVEMLPVAAAIRTTGVVMMDESRVAVVTSRTAGYIERLFANVTGQPIARGQAVMQIYSPELLAAQQELIVAQRMKSTMPELASAARARLRLLDMSDAQIDEVMKSGNARRTVTLVSPVSGVVVEKYVVNGQAIQAGEPLLRIADLSRVWVEAQLREADAPSVRKGMTAEVEVTGLPGRVRRGTVDYVYPTLDPQARALRARIVLANPGGALKPGMFATVRLTAPTRSVLSVPASAIVNTGTRTLVFVDMGNGRFMPHDVVSGRTGGERTEILSGVTAGQRVVASAQFLIDSESNLGEVMRGMIGQMNPGGRR